MLLYSRTMPRQDHERLTDAAKLAAHSSSTHTRYLNWFRTDLRRARVVPPAEVPPNVITMNSRFAIEDPEGVGSMCLSLVYPEFAAPREGRISVLSPMGMVLLGARVGEEVAWSSADGPRAAKVLRLLYQPEAAGDFHL